MIAFSRLAWARPLRANSRSFSGFSSFFSGFGNQHGGGPPPDNDKFYKMLGVEKNASEKEIKSAYKKAALKHHPDKGGSVEKFKDISRAYEVLGDKEKRHAYDTFGEAGVDSQVPNQDAGFGFGVDPVDIFETVFGFGSRQAGSARMEDKRYRLQFTLEDMYNGVSRSVSVEREVLCTACKGEGGVDIKTCPACKGHGQTAHMQKMGPFVHREMRTCRSCRGLGRVTPPGKSCKPCEGVGVVKKTETLSVDVPPGTVDGYEFKFAGKSDQRPGVLSGDLIITAGVEKHSVFDRFGSDLFMKRTISLQDALCGFHFRVKFLNGKHLFVSSEAGRVVKPGDVWKLAGNGMPRPHGNTTGDLFISFDIKFPESVHVGERARELLKELGVDNSTALPTNAESKTAAPLSKDEIDKLNKKIQRHARF